MSWKELEDLTGWSRGKLRYRVRKHIEDTDAKTDGERVFFGVQADQIIKALKKGSLTLRQLSEVVDRSESTVRKILDRMREAGYGVIESSRRVKLPDKPIVEFESPPLFPTGDTAEVSFGVVSDTHGGSHSEQITALHDFVDIAIDSGVRHILHAGDAFAGKGVYRGQETEVYAVGGEEQAEVVAHNLPQNSGLHWYLLGGNHGYSFYRRSGMDVRKELTALRDDITLLPYDAGDVPLLPGIDAHLWHPSGGVPYALSYRGQKGAAQIAQDEMMQVVMGDKAKPTIRLVVIGHLHVMYMFDHGPMLVLGAGCFEGQNSYLQRKKLVPHVGGWILHCKFVDGILHRLTPERIRYREIEDDWRHWNSRRLAKDRKIERLEPIFSMNEALVET